MNAEIIAIGSEMLTGDRVDTNSLYLTAELNKLLKTFPDYQVAQDEVEAFKIQVLDKLRDGFKSTLVPVKKTASVSSSAKD